MEEAHVSSLHGRIAVITGAGRGLGRAYALRFAALGAHVVVNDAIAAGESRAAGSAADAVVDEIVAAGGSAVAHLGSVADWESAGELIELALARFGGLDVLVNNAGILRDHYLAALTESEWDDVVAVHLKGHFAPTRHAIGHWKQAAKAGHPVDASIINTASEAGLRGYPGSANYCAAKSGILALTLVEARELDRYGIRANAISPGARTRLSVSAPGFAEAFDAQAAAAGWDIWSPDNVAPVAAWLASAGCRVTGQVLSVCGGRVTVEQGWRPADSAALDRPWTEEELQERFGSLQPPAIDHFL